MKAYIFLALAAPQLSAFAQESTERKADSRGNHYVGHVSLIKREIKSSPAIFIGSGIAMPSSQMKTNAMTGNGLDFNGAISIPIIKKIGITTKVNYTKANYNYSLPATIQPIQYSNGSGAVNKITGSKFTGGPGTVTLKFIAGPSLLFSWGHFFITPSILAGYTSITQNSFAASDSVLIPSNPSQNKNINLYSSVSSKSSGFVVQPEIKFGFALNNSISLFGAAGYSFGPGVTNSYQTFVPEGNPNAEGVYNYQQLLKGNYVSSAATTTTSKWQSLSLNAGIAFAIRGKVKDVKVEPTGKYANDSTRKHTKTGHVSINKKEINPNNTGGVNNTKSTDITMTNSVGTSAAVTGGRREINPGNTIEIIDASQLITFRWTPLVPKPQEPVTYRLKVWQLMQGQNGTQAMKTNTPVATKEITDGTEATVNEIITGPCKPPYMCDFVWEVQAVSKTGENIGEPQGGRMKNTQIINSDDAETKTVEANEPVTFRWTPLVPKPQQPVTYRLKVWQLMQGQNGTQAMKSNKPIIEKDIAGATEATVNEIITGPCKPPYMCDFVWEVQAVSTTGENAGESKERKIQIPANHRPAKFFRVREQ